MRRLNCVSSSWVAAVLAAGAFLGLGTLAGAVEYQGRWFKGDTHCHTDHSDGGLNQLADWLPRDVTCQTHIQAALSRGMDWLSITDHRTLDQVYDPLHYSEELLLLPGEEWGSHPHGTMWGLLETIDAAGSSVTSCQSSNYLAHAQGAMFTMSHPGDKNGWFTDEVGDQWTTKGMDAIEVWSLGPFNLSMEANRNTVAKWDEMLNQGQHITGIGASDNHFAQIDAIAGVGNPCTWVYARELTEIAILEGLRAGHVFITANPTGGRVAFSADGDGDGTYESIMGDIVNPLASMIDFRVQVLNGAGAKVYLYSNTGLLESWDVEENNHEHHFQRTARTAWYRLEISKPQIEGETPVRDMIALTNPIYVEVAGDVPTPTPTPVVSPKPTERALPPGWPAVTLAGYWDTRVTASQGGTIQMIAMLQVPVPSSPVVSLAFEGVTTDLTLKDDGSQGDVLDGDGVYGVRIPLPAGAPSGHYLLSLWPKDQTRHRSGFSWPWLNVE